MVRLKSALVFPAAILVALACIAGPPSATPANSASPPRYDHIFLVVDESHGFQDLIGNPAAPNLNALANKYGLATAYYAVSKPSEPNYVSMIGGSAFGIADDNPYWMNTIAKPSLISQLDQAHISWKAYLDGLPHPGYAGGCYPVRCNGAPEADTPYATKHNGIPNFTTSRNSGDWSKQVPIGQLSTDLSTGRVPAFSYIIPNECHDMHGAPPYCIDSGNPGDPQDQKLTSIGDQYLGQLVSNITSAAFWSRGNNAIAITFDEGNKNDRSGCCDANPGTGRVATTIVTSHGPRGLKDPTPYNHYSMLQTLQENFGRGCLEFTCDTANVKPLSALLAVTGSAPDAFQPAAEPKLSTPTPVPSEPTSSTAKTPSGSGWSVVPSPMRGSNDNTLGALAASGPNDIWAVGNFLPDTPNSNQDATLTLASHWDGTTWSAVPTPNAGPNFNTLYGVATRGGKAWAVGARVNDNFEVTSLVEVWDGGTWSVATNPHPGAGRDLLFSASAAGDDDVWAVGEQQPTDGRTGTLAEHWDGHAWSVFATPDPGTAGNSLYGVHAVSPSDVWAVGQQQSTTGSDQALVEHWDGHSWNVTSTPKPAGSATALYSVTGSGDSLWAVGEIDSAGAGSRPLAERFAGGEWHTVNLPAGSAPSFAALWGVSAAGNDVWAVGASFDPAAKKFRTLVLRQHGQDWSVVSTPNPGTRENVLGGVLSTAGTVWAVGYYKDGSHSTLIQRTNS